MIQYSYMSIHLIQYAAAAAAVIHLVQYAAAAAAVTQTYRNLCSASSRPLNDWASLGSEWHLSHRLSRAMLLVCSDSTRESMASGSAGGSGSGQLRGGGGGVSRRVCGRTRRVCVWTRRVCVVEINVHGWYCSSQFSPRYMCLASPHPNPPP